MEKQQSRIAQVVEAMAPSGIRAFFDLVLGMKDVLSLGVGEPDFVTPWHIREAAIFSLEQGVTSYTSNKGLMKLRLSVQRTLSQQYGIDYNADDEILITVGVSEAVDLVMRALLNAGDQVIIPQPCYVSYGPVVSLAGGVPVFINAVQEQSFKITPEQLQRACTPRTRALMLNYPSNPTGVTYSMDELEALWAVCRRNNLIVISDEIYADLAYDDKHVAFPSLPDAREHTIYLNGFSKAYAMTGWRIGYACGPRDIIAAMTKIHQYTMLCAPITGQLAACEALHAGQPEMLAMRAEYRRRRDYLISGLRDIGMPCVKPAGAFYAFPSIAATKLTALEFAQRLLQEQKVAVVPGCAFGRGFEQYIRIAYATTLDQLREALRRLKLFLASLP